jgi:hypothetical protein
VTLQTLRVFDKAPETFEMLERLGQATVANIANATNKHGFGPITDTVLGRDMHYDDHLCSGVASMLVADTIAVEADRHGISPDRANLAVYDFIHNPTWLPKWLK